MKRNLVIVLMMALWTSIATAEVDFVTVKECRGMIFGRMNEGEIQEKVNTKLRDKLREVKASKIYFIQYGDEESFFRSKKDGSACIVVTAWYDRG